MAPRLLLAQSRHFDAKIAYQKKQHHKPIVFLLYVLHSDFIQWLMSGFITEVLLNAVEEQGIPFFP